MNIDLKKHGLKEIKFADLVDGEEFNIPNDFNPSRTNPPEFYRRKLVGQNIIFADGSPMAYPEDVSMYTAENDDDIVFIEA